MVARPAVCLPMPLIHRQNKSNNQFRLLSTPIRMPSCTEAAIHLAPADGGCWKAIDTRRARAADSKHASDRSAAVPQGECRMARVGAEASTRKASSKRNPAVQAITATLALCLTGPVAAHGGGLDKHGCHNDRKRGGYHCHRGGAAPASRDAPSAYDFSPARPAPARAAPGSRAFANCSEARAAGAAPVRRGDPGYGPHLDRDGDGVGCEPRRR